MNILLTVEELAKYLKVKPDTIYKKVRKGELPAIKLGKLVRFPKELIDEWVVDQARKTMKDVKAARQMVEHRVEEAVGEVRKTAKVASKVLEAKVPTVIEKVRKAPLNRKQEALAKGLKTLWNDLNSGLTKKPKARKQTKAAAKGGSTKKARKKSSVVRMAQAPTTAQNDQVA
ncbi:MAG: helix-turn-helix domain-containing protein [Bacteriovoracia bacterium]